MTARTLPVVLAFALLLGQQAGYAHALSHVNRDAAKEQLSHSSVCAKCSTFQQLSSALPTTACIAVEQAHGIVQNGTVVRDSVSRTVAVFHSRAPPNLD
jgi:aspartyl/asparaginyl beta-hydroxylase (cupin superfamily)